MIKFIASDLDGTLLQNGAQTLDDEVFDLILKLKEKGILFAAASGRQYMNMRHLFAPVRNDMMFIAENGALVMYKDMLINNICLPHDLSVALMRDIYAQEHLDVMLNGQYTCYMMPKRKEFSDYMLYTMGYTSTLVKDIFSVQEDFYKVSIYDYNNNALETAKEFAERWSPYFSIAVSGRHWVDFNLGNKGAAIRRVQDELKLKKHEMMAFGDNYNDEYMLGAVAYGYAMENASDEVKKMAPYTCRRVEDVLRAVLDGAFDKPSI